MLKKKRGKGHTAAGAREGGNQEKPSSFPNSWRVSTGPEPMAVHMVDQCRAQTKILCLLPMICRRLKEGLKKIIVIMEVLAYLGEEDHCWPTLSRAAFQGNLSSSRQGSSWIRHTLSPSPPCAQQDGWLRWKELFSQRKTFFFVYLLFSKKLNRQFCPPWYILSLALYPARDTLDHQLSYLQTIERQGQKGTPNSSSSTLSCTDVGQRGSEKETDLLKVMQWVSCGLEPRCPDSWLSILPLHRIVTSSAADLRLRTSWPTSISGSKVFS